MGGGRGAYHGVAEAEAGELEGMFRDFNIECRHPSHDTRCSSQEAPTWPRACLRTTRGHENDVVLSLEWRPHSGIGAFTPTPDGRARASEVRELFKGYRKGVGGILVPYNSSDPVPEMMCFGFSRHECMCLYYGMGDGEEGTDPSRSVDFGECSLPLHHFLEINAGQWVDSEVGLDMHALRTRKGKGICLTTAYQRQVVVCRKTDTATGKVNPTHEWFHAMDPDTYDRPEDSHTLPICRDGGCMNYYRRPGVFRCIYTPTEIHHPCFCPGPKNGVKKSAKESTKKGTRKR